jgi:hypothetical protein
MLPGVPLGFKVSAEVGQVLSQGSAVVLLKWIGQPSRKPYCSLL